MNPYEHAQQQQCNCGQPYKNSTLAGRIVTLANCSLKQAQDFLLSVETEKNKQRIDAHFGNAQQFIDKLQNLGVTKQEIISRLGLEEVTL